MLATLHRPAREAKRGNPQHRPDRIDSMSDTSPAILWFRNDLRLDDHPALAAALKSGRPVLPVFILDEQPGPGRPPGAASRWWLHHSLASLAAHIADVGGQLILRRGATHTILRQLVEQTGAEEIYFTRAYESGDKSLELELQQRLGDVATLRRYGGQLLFEPEALLKKDGKPYRVFTPFWRACCRLPEPPNAIPEPASWPAIAEPPASDALADWQLLPTRPDWAGGLGEAWISPARRDCNRTRAGVKSARGASGTRLRPAPSVPA